MKFERTPENIALVQDILRFIAAWGSEDAMDERGWEAQVLLEKLELRYGVKTPPKAKVTKAGKHKR